jgi:hypothetical protein
MYRIVGAEMLTSTSSSSQPNNGRRDGIAFRIL